MSFKRISLALLGAVAAALVLIAAAGHYKFNILGDDVYFDANAAEPGDLVGSWSVQEDSLNSEMHLFTDGSVRMNSDMTTEHGTWGVTGGQLVLDIVSDDAPEEMGFDILSWNETRLHLQTTHQTPTTLARMDTSTVAPANLPLNCPGGIQGEASISIGGYAIPSSDITDLSLDADQGTYRISLSVSEAAAAAITNVSANYLGKPLPVMLHDLEIGAPIVHQEIDARMLDINVREATVPTILTALGKGCLNG